MAHLNLLPWREELRRQKQKEFATVAVGAMIVAALVVLLVHMRMEGVIDMQKQRNAYLEQQINTLNQKIGRIKELESVKASLLARMNIIQELQGSRPLSVHLIDELAKTLPEGVYLKNFTQKNTELAMEGVAESNARVSDYMRNIDESKWLSDPKLDLIQTKEVDRHRIADFTLRGKQRTVHATNMGDIGSEGS